MSACNCGVDQGHAIGQHDPVCPAADVCDGAAPDPSFDSEGVPLCRPHCPHHDGKRCGLTGFRPERICAPEVIRMAARLRKHLVPE